LYPFVTSIRVAGMDEELAGRARAGDREAFEAVLHRHAQAMLRFADFVLHDRSAAEDAVQEAVMTAWRKQDQLQDASAVLPWLRRIVWRECLRWRRHPFWRAVVLPDRVIAPSADLAAQIDVANAVRRLSPKLRAVIFLHYYEDQTLKQVGAELGIPESTAKTQLYTALRRLESLLPGYGPSLGEEPR
jgi:RNA polymerase sigma-70 factor (ECF subfamily)